MASKKKKPSNKRFQAYWERQPGFVFFLAAAEPPAAIRIGVTTRDTFKKRMSQLQEGNHEQLFLRGVVPFFDGEKPMVAATAKEAELREQFAAARRFGERKGESWFNPSADLLAWIEANAEAPEAIGLPAAVPEDD